jgi:peptidoglycan-associated lipoprotein
MINRIRVLGSVCGLVILLGIAACAPSITSKSDTTSTNRPGAAASGAEQRAGEGQRSGTGESNTGVSSLKQLEEGKSPTTPASSPLKDVFYEFDRYDLTTDARSTLRANADWLKSNPAARVEIEGHCDERGTSEYNLALGAKRAQAARDFLSTLGISAERLSTISYGQEIPVCREHSEDCWKQNRRARFVILQGRSTS